MTPIATIAVLVAALVITGWQIVRASRAEAKALTLKNRLRELKEEPVASCPDFFVSFKSHPDIQNLGEVSHSEHRARAKARELRAKEKCRTVLVRYHAVEVLRD